MIERRIIIGLITSTDFLKALQKSWNPAYLESSTAKHLAHWCWDYYEKYGRAPGKDIEGIYYEKIKSSKFPKAVAEEIGQDILPGLSKEYERDGLSIQPLIDDAEKYFRERKLSTLSLTIQSLIGEEQLEEAEKMIEEFIPLTSGKINIDNFILTTSGIRNRKRRRPTLLMKPWLREGQMSIIYGNFGC